MYAGVPGVRRSEIARPSLREARNRRNTSPWHWPPNMFLYEWTLLCTERETGKADPLYTIHNHIHAYSLPSFFQPLSARNEGVREKAWDRGGRRRRGRARGAATATGAFVHGGGVATIRPNRGLVILWPGARPGLRAEGACDDQLRASWRAADLGGDPVRRRLRAAGKERSTGPQLGLYSPKKGE